MNPQIPLYSTPLLESDDAGLRTLPMSRAWWLALNDLYRAIASDTKAIENLTREISDDDDAVTINGEPVIF